jgi:K+-sensing histidine kinase KdpD
MRGRLAATAACTLAGLAMRERFDVVNIAMVYLLAVVVVALRYPARTRDRDRRS